MLFFGHTGITLGTSILFKKAAPFRSKWLTAYRRFDLRVVFLGSVVPDIIDKPLGIFLLKETLSSGRTFGHTLLFLVAVCITGVLLYRRTNVTWLLAVTFGTAMHLVFDQMWRMPQTLFWPLLGFVFEKKNVSDWVTDTVTSLFTNPADYIPELIGLAILLWLIIDLIHRKKLGYFFKTGQLS